ncbi:hypothetical protein [Pseudomonas haemolytica]|uniref:Uncharacterized protein n=1 Tax=Pseudomonas haemolytica TaxID=2600065 RepID=A0A5P1DCT6_9PSED|nr:hypothetical protein [Pseudomonas haemolytica]MBJ2246212.1 hypothetical protein [Pseudomonas haemolytica]MBJ2273908.1 hypothetical protein [Pseudomonas haemolytica]MBK3448516.1 hypothetical protein [Pseudomonas haemolytica]MBK3461122.1 hypothetical protein [Pseudomonas haemolytica]MRJ38307.1 hypothetical protein [Pseudomonas haemolytica]
MSEQNRTVGTYIGTMPEDIYIRLGEIWDDDTGPQKVTKKIYTTHNNMNYDIQVYGIFQGDQKKDAPERKKTSQSESSAPYALPLPPNLKPGTPEAFLSIGIGDIHRTDDGTQRRVANKAFREQSNGMIAIEIIYDPS